MKKMSILLSFLLCCQLSFAQEPSFTISSSKETIHLDETFILTFKLVDLEANDFQRPTLENFKFLGSAGTATEQSWVNGKHSSKASFSFKVGALKPGTYVIESISIGVGERLYETEPISIIVLDKYLNEKNREQIEKRKNQHEMDKTGPDNKKRKVYKI